MRESTPAKVKTIAKAKVDVRPETTAAKARTRAKAKAGARPRIAAVRAKTGVRPAKAFSDVAGSLFFAATTVPGGRWQAVGKEPRAVNSRR
jgi:hypothetical protein